MLPKDIARFWMKVKKTNGCWEWQGALHPGGYGRFSIKQKMYRAHRISYWLENLNFASDLFICHKCDNPKCVNPDHLFSGSPKENTQDMIKKGRIRYVRERKKSSSSKYYGVSYRKESGKWRSRCMIGYKNTYIGQFDTEIAAAKAYDMVILKINKTLPLKDQKLLNFPL